MPEPIESRLARVEREVEILMARVAGDKSNWIAEITEQPGSSSPKRR